MELTVLTATRNWFAVTATLLALGGVVVATYVMLRSRGRQRRRLR